MSGFDVRKRSSVLALSPGRSGIRVGSLLSRTGKLLNFRSYLEAILIN